MVYHYLSDQWFKLERINQMSIIVDYDKSEGRALRLLEIYFYIEENPGVNAEKLAEIFKVGVATLYRDIQSLRKMGINVSYETPITILIGEVSALPAYGQTN